LYVEEKSQDPKKLIQQEAVLKMVFVRDIDAQKIKETWQESFRACGVDNKTIQKEISLFCSRLGKVQKNDSVTIFFTKETVEVQRSDGKKYLYENPQFREAVFRVFLYHTDTELKDSLLGKDQK